MGKQNSYRSSPLPFKHALGIMSGTSMDGVDVAQLSVRWEGNTPKLATLGKHYHQGFQEGFRDKIRTLLGQVESNTHSQNLERELTEIYQQAVNGFQKKYPNDSIDILGMHGQTLTHLPEHQFSWQLGDGQALADKTRFPVVFDFRQNDLQQKGEGAPLAPIFHEALCEAELLPAPPFGVLNIGGVSNISLIGKDHDLIAFDCGPGNGPIDDYCQHILSIPFDEDGKIASEGVVNSDLVSEYLAHPYFLLEAPKSLDRQDFGFQSMLGISAPDALISLCTVSAAAIALSVQKYLDRIPITQLAVAGGGRKNLTLMNALARLMPHIEIRPIEEFHSELHGDAIEAWAFAWLSILRLGEQPASFPSTTGCHQPTIAGKIAYPKKT